MIVYQSTKEGFLRDVLSNEIDVKISNAFYFNLGRNTSPNEILSWKNSMMHMNNVLIDTSIPNNSGVSIEFQIPLTSKRVDFIITGLNEDKKEQVIIIELKQWQNAQLTEKSAVVKTFFQHGETETTHPSYQAWSYAALLQDYNTTIQDQNISLIPCAYLHNYPNDENNTITNPFYKEYVDKAPVFFKSDAERLREFIKKFIKYGDEKDILYKIENGRFRPSKQLADCLSSMLKGNQEFIMLDDQKIVYETALSLAQKARVDKKQVLIIEGGPGTGKSVVAINLLVEFTKRGLVSKYISKNSAPRDVYAAKLSKTIKKNRINNLFGGSGSFHDIDANIFDALIVDEAHRLNYKSGLFQNLGENQALEIMCATKFTIFFVDDNQRIHIKDIGHKKQLELWAKEIGAIVTNLSLSSQFRCNGSDGYLAWIDNSLQIHDTANIDLNQDDFDFRIFSNPIELREEISKKNEINNKSRMVAGYCWDWKSKKDINAYDVVIPEFDFKMKWNLTKDGSTWIIAPESINEIGCIHTCQGLELDYVGVIVGNDLKCKDGKIIADNNERSSNDRSISGLKSLIKENKAEGLKIADSIIKNTYRTLFTRGMKGCYVYFCDKELEEYFRKRTKEHAESREIDIPTATKIEYRIEPQVNDDIKYIDYLPLYSLKAACGLFGEYQDVDENGWIKVEGLGKLGKNMFVIQAVGNSMQTKINDGDLCVFRANVVGSREGKIVLVQHTQFDSDHGGKYSIKKYTSKKAYDKDTGEWMHESIILEPLNKEYSPIILNDTDQFVVIGEFIGVIKA